MIHLHLRRRIVSLVSLLGAGSLALLGSACSGADAPRSEDDEHLGAADSALTEDQCSYFDVNGSIQICHQIGSGKFKILKLSDQSCIHAHGSHAADYVTSTDPSSPLYDPTCQGNGCSLCPPAHPPRLERGFGLAGKPPLFHLHSRNPSTTAGAAATSP